MLRLHSPYVLNELLNGEFPLGQIDKVGGDLVVGAENAGRGRQPASVSAHYLDHGDGFYRINRAVADYLLNCRRHILSRRAEAGGVVGDGEVVVDGLGYADDSDLRALADKIGRELNDCVHGIVAADIEEGLDAVLLEAAEDLFVYLGVLLPRGELVAAGAQDCGGCLAQELHILVGSDDPL